MMLFKRPIIPRTDLLASSGPVVAALVRSHTLPHINGHIRAWWKQQRQLVLTRDSSNEQSVQLVTKEQEAKQAEDAEKQPQDVHVLPATTASAQQLPASTPTPQASIQAADSCSAAYINAASRLASLALPLMVQNVVGYCVSIVNMSYVGALGATELSAYVLGSSVYNVCGLSVALGLSTGMDTLAGSAFGAKEYGKLGLVLQRALVVCWAACVPVAIAWFNADALLCLLGQQPEISKLTARMLVLWVPVLFLAVLNECLKRFLQAQRLVKPLAVSGLAGVVLAPVFCHLTMAVWKMGMDGSALASILGQLTTLVGLAGYCMWRSHKLKDAPEQPWRGWQLGAAAAGWREYLQYGLPAAIMICLEWWVYEAIVIMAGWLPSAGNTLACMGLCVNLNAWAYMVPLGLAAAVNTSVANALGAGDGRTAAVTFRTGLGMVALVQISLAALLLAAGPTLIQLITPDIAVQQLTNSVLPALAAVILLDGTNSVVSGVLRGAGRQRLGAVVNTLCCALAIPTAWFFAFKAGMGVHGFWLGVGVGAALQLTIILSILLRAKGGDAPIQVATPQLANGNGGDVAAGVAPSQSTNGNEAGADKAAGSTSVNRPWWSWDWSDEAERLRGIAMQPAH